MIPKLLSAPSFTFYTINFRLKCIIMVTSKTDRKKIKKSRSTVNLNKKDKAAVKNARKIDKKKEKE